MYRSHTSSAMHRKSQNHLLLEGLKQADQTPNAFYKYLLFALILHVDHPSEHALVCS